MSGVREKFELTMTVASLGQYGLRNPLRPWDRGGSANGGEKSDKVVKKKPGEGGGWCKVVRVFSQRTWRWIPSSGAMVKEVRRRGLPPGTSVPLHRTAPSEW